MNIQQHLSPRRSELSFGGGIQKSRLRKMIDGYRSLMSFFPRPGWYHLIICLKTYEIILDVGSLGCVFRFPPKSIPWTLSLPNTILPMIFSTRQSLFSLLF